MQCRQLHRNAGPFRQCLVASAFSDRVDGIGIGVEIAPRIVTGASGFTQHVEGIEKFAVRAGAHQSLFNRLPKHEMRAEQPHGLARGDADGRQAQPLDQRLNDALGCFTGMNDAGRQAERPCGGGDQETRGAGIVMRPVAGLQLVLDQAIGCFGVGHPQQRFRQHHQREPLLGGESISVQEILDTAEHAGARANRLDQTSGACVDAHFGIA